MELGWRVGLELKLEARKRRYRRAKIVGKDGRFMSNNFIGWGYIWLLIKSRFMIEVIKFLIHFASLWSRTICFSNRLANRKLKNRLSSAPYLFPYAFSSYFLQRNRNYTPQL